MARPASRKAVSSLPAIANIDEQLDEVVMFIFKGKTPRELSHEDLPDLASLNTDNLPVYLKPHAEAIVSVAKEAISGAYGSEQQGLSMVIRTMEVEGLHEGPSVIHLQDYQGR